jgi:hypothetical protein
VSKSVLACRIFTSHASHLRFPAAESMGPRPGGTMEPPHPQFLYLPSFSGGENAGEALLTPPTSPSLASPTSLMTLKSHRPSLDDDELDMMVFQTDESFQAKSIYLEHSGFPFPDGADDDDVTRMIGNQICQNLDDMEEPKTPTNQGIPFKIPGAPKATPPLSINYGNSYGAYTLIHQYNASSVTNGMSFMSIN